MTAVGLPTHERRAGLPVNGVLPVLVIVSGAPGAGKTTLARALSSRLRLPLLSKDELKEAIADELGPPADVTGSQRMGRAAYRVLYSVGRGILGAGGGVVIESNFRRGQAEAELRDLVACADARLIHCAAATPTVTSRYAERYRRGARHPVHLDADRSDALAADLAAGRFEPLLLEIRCLVVGTDDGYAPALDEILAFASPRRATGAA